MTDTRVSRFSLGAFAVAVATVGAGTAAGLAFVPGPGTYVGMLLGGLVAGLASEEKPLLETGSAAVLAGFGVLLAGTLVANGVVAALLAVGSVPPTPLLVSVALSFAVGAFGAHFGDELRDGLTAPVEESAPGPTGGVSVGRQASAVRSSDAQRATDEAGERRRSDAETVDGTADVRTERRSESAEPADLEREHDRERGD
jgi:hypothetical protein